MNKCQRCLFKEYYQDMGASTPICGREDDLEKAFKANNESGLCPWYITKDQVRELQDRILSLLKGGLT